MLDALRRWWRGPAREAAPLPHVVLDPAADTLGAATLPAVVRGGVPPEALDLSKAFEGFSPTPYLCQGGVWTIGYGSTRDRQGRPVTAHTPRMDEATAREWAARDLDGAAALLARDFPEGLPPRWWAAGVLMNNNLGRMASYGPTLVGLLRASRWREAAQQMRHYRNAGGAPSKGLRRRRWTEAAFALGMDAGEAKRRAWATIHTPDDWPPLPN